MKKRTLTDMIEDAMTPRKAHARSFSVPDTRPDRDLLKMPAGPRSVARKDESFRPVPPIKGYRPVGRGTGFKHRD